MDILLKEVSKLARKITGKSVSIDVSPHPHQDLNTIYVPDSNSAYQVLHEICHWIIATKEERKLPNLIFGEEFTFGRHSPDGDHNHYQMFQEKSVGYLQKHLLLKSDLVKFILDGDQDRVLRYLNYVHNDFGSEYEYSKFPNIERNALKQLREVESLRRLNILKEMKRLTKLVSNNKNSQK